MPSVPERQPIGDPISAVVMRVDETALLASAPLGDGELIAQGPLTVRYGVRIHGKPWLSIVPGLIAVDYGTFLTGEEAWAFLFKRSNLYPRAEIFGYRENGRDEQMWVRQLDLALPPQTLIYADERATTPLAVVEALIGSGEGLPARLLEWLPRYDSLESWRAVRDEA